MEPLILPKIFFIPFYFYLSSPPFEQIIKRINTQYDAFMVRIDPIDQFSDSKYTSAYYENEGIGFLEVGVSPVKTTKRILKYFNLFMSIKLIKKFLDLHKPDCVVVNTDLGGVLIRVLLTLCEFRDIKILIICPTDVLIGSINRKLYRALYNFPSRLIKVINALIFKGDVLGSFSLHSNICVISNDAKKRLVEKGKINESRILVADLIFPFAGKNTDSQKQDIVPKGYDYTVTIYTEMIQTMYGDEYLIELNKIIKDVIGIISQSMNVYFIIKLHPREPGNVCLMYHNMFDAENIKVIKEIELSQLLEISQINIAHYSTVLITALIERKHILSINLNRDKEKSFLPEKLRSIFEISNKEEMVRKILDILHGNNDYSIQSAIAVERFNTTEQKMSVKSVFETIIK